MPTDAERRAYLDEMVRQRGYVLDFHKGLTQVDFDVMVAFNQLLERTYLQERHLDRKTKELIFCNSLTVIRASQGQIQSHITAALDAGATPEEVLEAIELALPEAGVVAFMVGFQAWRTVVGVAGIEPSVTAFEGGSGT